MWASTTFSKLNCSSVPLCAPFVAVVHQYVKDKAEELESLQLRHSKRSWTEDNELGLNVRPVSTQQSSSNRNVYDLLVIHDKVFEVTKSPDSCNSLREWMVKAALGEDCPAAFRFPAVGAKIPKTWIEANKAMDDLKEKKPFVMWSDAVRAFSDFMQTKNDQLDDPSDVLMQAMRHREAEGGVLVFLENSSASGDIVGMLHLDPCWLIELVRRLTDHNLVDPSKQGDVRLELEEYAKQHKPRLSLDDLWREHRSVHGLSRRVNQRMILSNEYVKRRTPFTLLLIFMKLILACAVWTS